MLDAAATSPSRWRPSSRRSIPPAPSAPSTSWRSGSSARTTTSRSTSCKRWPSLTSAHLEAVVLSSAIDDLLLDRVAAGGAGHPLLLAIAAAEAAGRAGLPVGHRRGRRRRLPRPQRLPDPVLVDPARGALGRRARPRVAGARGSAAIRWRRASSTASASAPSASARCAGRCAPPSCDSRCPSRRRRASASRPTCGASARG